jgi:L-ascorbate metabolism protein UlaG (beta-lactamase superfamily)
MHYDTFDAINANIREFINLVEYEDKECVPMKPGDEIDLL